MKKEVEEKYKAYPEAIRKKLDRIRSLIFDVAEENGLGSVDETLKWGEPSYLVKGGSAVRIDWKIKEPYQYVVYFNCNTKLVDTFKELYGGKFNFSGNRAIVFGLNEPIHEKQLKHCIKLALIITVLKHYLF